MTSRPQLLTMYGERLAAYVADRGLPPGLHPSRREPLLRQLVDSDRRNFVIDRWHQQDDLSPDCVDPASEQFHPLKAAVLHQRAGHVEEAFWLVFLFAHIGKNRRGGWTLLRRVYGALGAAPAWTWEHVSEAPEEFRDWLDAHHDDLSAPGGGFGNHRKFESLAGRADNGTGATVASYIDWSGSPPNQQARFAGAVSSAAGDPALAFDLMYRSLDAVVRFGRLGRFDYLRMVGRLKLASIAPGKVYFQGSSGPRAGALLLWGKPTAHQGQDLWFEEEAKTLAAYLDVDLDVIEDALCNWQKSPEIFIHFAG